VGAVPATVAPVVPPATAAPQVFDFTEQIRHAQERLDAELLPDET
jgi:hypothetical protein